MELRPVTGREAFRMYTDGKGAPGEATGSQEPEASADSAQGGGEGSRSLRAIPLKAAG